MKEAVIILSLMGCDDNADNCQYIDTPDAVFASEEDCLRRSDELFELHASADFPMILAKCDAKEFVNVEGLPDSDVEVADADPELAAHDQIPVQLSTGKEEGWFQVAVRNPSRGLFERTKSLVGAINPFKS